MRKAIAICLGLCVFASAAAQPAAESLPASEASQAGGTPVADLIAAVSRSSGRKFLVDPRVRANVALAGRSPSSIGYPELITLLRLHGFAAVEGSGVVLVVPDAMVRTMEVPLISERETRPESEIVTDVYRVRNSSAAMLVPILRPLLPQYGHLAADLCSNMLIIVDTFANVRRIEAIVQRLDVGEPYKEQACDARAAPGK